MAVPGPGAGLTHLLSQKSRGSRRWSRAVDSWAEDSCCAPELPRARGARGREGVGCRACSVGGVAESGLWGGQPCAGGCALGLQAECASGQPALRPWGPARPHAVGKTPAYSRSAGGQTWGPEPLWDDRRGPSETLQDRHWRGLCFAGPSSRPGKWPFLAWGSSRIIGCRSLGWALGRHLGCPPG